MHLYHWVPEKMVGDILQPLNTLRETHPELYAEYVKKYQGREELLKARVPILGCLWNDVLHLTPVNPQEVMKAYRDTGLKARTTHFFKIPDSSLKRDELVIYKHTKIANDDWSIDPSEILRYSSTIAKKFSHLPDAARQYFEREKSAGRRPLLFGFVPHVLYRGQIDISKCEVIES